MKVSGCIKVAWPAGPKIARVALVSEGVIEDESFLADRSLWKVVFCQAGSGGLPKSLSPGAWMMCGRVKAKQHRCGVDGYVLL